jgi:hypothetical protein
MLLTRFISSVESSWVTGPYKFDMKRDWDGVFFVI